MPNNKNQLNELLSLVVQEQASDLHITVGHPPILRIESWLIPLKGKKISAEDSENLARALMTEEQYQRILSDKEVDFSYSFEEKARFRVNIFRQRGYFSSALRLIPNKVKTINELNLPPLFHNLAKATQGFVLITGPSSQGKSTSLASLIDEINRSRSEHIITIEDPIEYLFEDDRSVIEQREVYRDTLSFSRALRATFRQDPDVIMVGEMRDPETMSIAITAAETGHLGFFPFFTKNPLPTQHKRGGGSFSLTREPETKEQHHVSCH